jgi:deoxyribodipyrimidine photo-lyase
MQRILVWFKSDLRLRDNEVLTEALKHADEVIPFYCFDNHYYQDLPLGFPKTGPFRAQFIRESVANLRENLQKIGSNLIVRQGNTAQAIQELHQSYPLDAIYCAQEVTYEERQIEEKVRGLEIPLQGFWNYSLYHLDDLPFEVAKTPRVFTPLRKKLEKYSQVREELPAPDKVKTPASMPWGQIPELADLGLETPEKEGRAVLDFRGGETQAWERLEHYFWDQDLLKEYKKTRNGLVGADYSSKFSAWLSQGCISPRSIYAQIKKYEREVKKNSSTYWLFFELVWRDFFRLVALKNGEQFFRMPRDLKPAHSPKHFKQWQQGRTGQDFVDANMREIYHTGFMSNRGRQNVASFLVKDLGQHWYTGAAWFESQLIDYDVCSNYGNWTYLAGVGNDPRNNRWFNVESQAERYDGDGTYRKLWLND